MSVFDTVFLLFIIALGTYFQTVTGFGLAMIVIGVSSGLELTSVPFIATVVSIISLANSGLALRNHIHHINWECTNTTLLGVVPSSILGVLLLNYLNVQAKYILEFLLGLVIVYSGVIFALRPRQRTKRSRLRAFFSIGFISGLCGGLFGMPGPPIIFHMYRQPFTLVETRNMLLLIFACTAFSRTAYEVVATGLPKNSLLISLLALPCVAAATIFAQRFPPPVRPVTMRQITFISLVLIGLALMYGSVTNYFD